MVYDNFKAACERKKTNITTVLKEIGRSTGMTGNWSKGSAPTLDVTMEIAEHLRISLDELVYGAPTIPDGISADDYEWLEIISHIPKDKHPMCKDFLRTHMVEPIKTPVKKRA